MCNKSQSPALSVVMSVYNGSAHLEEAVRSILAQTFKDFEFIIVDDCSSDDTPKILKKLAFEDPRIRIHRLKQNCQIAAALNVGLELARAPLIARMDADDIAYPTRFMRQVAVMDDEPDLILLGTSIRRVDPNRIPIRVEIRDLNAAAAAFVTPLRTPVPHPTAMFRRLAPDGTPFRYDPALVPTEDFDLFARMSLVGNIRCLKEVLLDYRVHPTSQMANDRSGLVHKGNIVMERIHGQILAPELAKTMLAYRKASSHEGGQPMQLANAMDDYRAHFTRLYPEHKRQFRSLAAMELHRFLSGWQKNKLKALIVMGRIRPGWVLPLLNQKLHNQLAKRHARPQARESTNET